MKRRKLTKAERKIIYKKTDGRCAYCGKELENKWHADHIKSFYNGGSCDLDNFFPACPRCNNWKRSLSVEGFRLEISKQTERLRRRVPGFRLAEDFGLVEAPPRGVVFWFELLEDAK